MTKETKEWRPRMYVDITQEQALRLTQVMPHGSRKPAFVGIANMLIAFVEEHGYAGIGAIADGKAKIVFKQKDASDVQTKET